MVYTIKKGKHRACPPMIGLFYDKKVMSRRVTFDRSCAYTLPGEDQEDINKLFGIGYFPSHHTDSARFGWRYNPSTDKIEILAYCYVNSERLIYPLASFDFNKEYTLELQINDDTYSFYVQTNFAKFGFAIPKTHKKVFGFPLGLYFGGNNPAPHKMKIKIIK